MVKWWHLKPFLTCPSFIENSVRSGWLPAGIGKELGPDWDVWGEKRSRSEGFCTVQITRGDNQGVTAGWPQGLVRPAHIPWLIHASTIHVNAHGQLTLGPEEELWERTYFNRSTHPRFNHIYYFYWYLINYIGKLSNLVTFGGLQSFLRFGQVHAIVYFG